MRATSHRAELVTSSHVTWIRRQLLSFERGDPPSIALPQQPLSVVLETVTLDGEQQLGQAKSSR